MKPRVGQLWQFTPKARLSPSPGYTGGTHIIANHSFQSSFASLPRSSTALEELAHGFWSAVSTGVMPDVPKAWLDIRDEVFLAAPSLQDAAAAGS